MVNQEDFLLKIKEVMPSEMIEENKDALDMAKKNISKETVWQKMFTYTKKKKQMKTSI